MNTKKDNLSDTTSQEIAKSNLGMVKSLILKDVLHDCAIKRPPCCPCCPRSRSIQELILKGEPRNIAESLMSVFNQVSVKKTNEIELTAQSLSSSHRLSKEHTKRQFLRAHLKVLSHFVTTTTRSPL